MRLNLLIDADDTLWENNIYFEQAFEEFVDYLDHSTLSAVEIRAVSQADVGVTAGSGKHMDDRQLAQIRRRRGIRG